MCLYRSTVHIVAASIIVSAALPVRAVLPAQVARQRQAQRVGGSELTQLRGSYYAIADARTVEGRELAFKVSRTGDRTGHERLTFRVRDRSAKNGRDYRAPANGVVDFPADTGEQIIRFATVDDGEVNGTRVFDVVIDNLPGGRKAWRAQARGSIDDNDIKPPPPPPPPPKQDVPNQLEAPPPEVPNQQESPPLQVPPAILTISGAPQAVEGGDLSFTVATGGVPAIRRIYVKLAVEGGQWLVASPSVVEIEAGATETNLVLQTRPSPDPDGERTVRVTIAGADGGQIGIPRSATGVISDAAVELVQFSVRDGQIARRAGATFPVQRMGSTKGAYTLDYRINSEGENGGSSGQVHFAPGQTTALIPVPDVQCMLTTAITISNPQPDGDITTATATGTVADNLPQDCKTAPLPVWQQFVDWLTGPDAGWVYFAMAVGLLIVWLSILKVKERWSFPKPIPDDHEPPVRATSSIPFSVEASIESGTPDEPYSPDSKLPHVEWATRVVIEPGASGISDPVEIVSKDFPDDR